MQIVAGAAGQHDPNPHRMRKRLGFRSEWTTIRICMDGRILAILLRDLACRYLVAGVHHSVAGATAKDPDVPTTGFTRRQIRVAVNKLELAGVVQARKAGYWTWRVYLDDVLREIAKLPGGHDTLDVLAHPVGWSVIARLARGQTKRSALNACGDSARVTDQLTALRHMKSLKASDGVSKASDEVILLHPVEHESVQDRLDRAALEIANQAWLYLFDSDRNRHKRHEIGHSYCSIEGFATLDKERAEQSTADTAEDEQWSYNDHANPSACSSRNAC